MSCKTMNIDLANVPPVPIQIGVAGENAFRTITFDASTWGADFPDATYTVVYKRSDGYIYPVLVNAAADAIVWSPTDTDTAVSGNGQIEVRLLDGETIGKTIVMQTFVAPSLSGDESEPSTPAPDWVNDVAADADRAEAAVEHYPKIVNGVWYVWDVQSEDFISTGIEAQGADGVSPTVTVTAITGGHRVTITDADGAHTFDVMDGEGGSGAVESVNGMTGAVVLGASDVGALPDDTQIPSKTSDLTNDSGFVTAQQAAASAPVQSVNGMTGAVTIPAGSSDAVLYTPQTLTAAQQEQARGNIGAKPPYYLTVTTENGVTSVDKTPAEIDNLSAAGYDVHLYHVLDGGVPIRIDYRFCGYIPFAGLAALTAEYAGNSYAAIVNADKTVEFTITDLDRRISIIEGDISTLQSGKADKSEIPSLTGYATETWVQNQGYQTAQDVQTAIAAIPDELPSVTASDNGKVLAVKNGEWSADNPVIVSGTDAQVANAVNDYLTQYGVPLRLSEEIKQALLDCFENVAWINDQGQTYYDALYAALYPPVDVLSISAVFTQGSAVIYETDSLDTLKQYLVVTATMTDSTTRTVTDYTLSGTLTVGTSTITVSYGGKSDTFNVTVSASEVVNYDIVGNPVFDGTWLVPASSNGGFVKTPQVFNPQSNTWIIRTEIETPASISGSQDVLGSVDANNASARALLAEINRGYYFPYLSSNGSAWDVSVPNAVTDGINLNASTVYLFEMYFDGTKYGVRASTDNGATWSKDWSKSATTPIYGQYAVGFGFIRNVVYGGKINMAKTEIYIGGNLWWSAM